MGLKEKKNMERKRSNWRTKIGNEVGDFLANFNELKMQI